MKDLSYTSVNETRPAVNETRPAFPSRKISSHLWFTAIIAKLEEMQRTFRNTHKPYLAIQMAQYLAHEPLCSVH